MMFYKIFNRKIGFEHFKRIYVKFIEEELQHLQYPSEQGHIPRFESPVFEGVNNFFAEHNVRIAYCPIHDIATMYSDLAEQTGNANKKGYKKAVWNHYRAMFNENSREIEARKEKRLRTLNEKKYPEYFFNARILIDTIFESDSAKEAYRKNRIQFEKLILIILYGKYSEMGTIQQNAKYFPPITSSECKKRLEKKVPQYKNNIIPKSELGNVFVRELTRLRDILLEIAEHEHIVNTINKFEEIIFNNSGYRVTKIPCYTEYIDPLINSENYGNQYSEYIRGIQKENLYEWIEQTARNIQSDPKCNFKSYEVIEYYLRVLVNNPHASVSNITEEVLKYDDISEEEKEILDRAVHNTKGNWEENLLEIIDENGHSNFINEFKRKHKYKSEARE